MRISVRYMAQLKQAAGVSQEHLELPGPCLVQDLIARLAAGRGGSLHRLLLDDDGRVHPTVLVFLGDEQANGQQALDIKDGDVVTLLSPIAGG